MFVRVNPNPHGTYEEDCVVRAIAVATNRSWDDIYIHICLEGFMMKTMPSVGKVWGNYLQSIGFAPYALPNTCPNCYSVREFCRDNPFGVFILTTNSHVIVVIDGNYYDTWDSGDEMPIIAWRREINGY